MKKAIILTAILLGLAWALTLTSCSGDNFLVPVLNPIEHDSIPGGTDSLRLHVQPVIRVLR